MHGTELSKSIPAVQPFGITDTVDAVFTGISKREIAVCSPRGNVAYSFWLSWQWLESKMRNKAPKSTL